MLKEMDKVYDPQSVEQRLYDTWEQKGYFHAEPNPDKKPFTIVIPPPNITGQLHMGHALDNANQDTLIRFKRMQGFEALWLPGTDHASIATEVKIVEQLAKEGLTKKDLGREGFLERAWEWKRVYGGRIVQQLKKLGSSCDWERERFTMDEGCSKAVRQAFVDLYNRGYIYRGDRIINWCPECKTALSDAEVDYEERMSSLWHIHYKSEDGSEGITVATTRPETMLGDTAVAVHPEDERYTHLVGKNVILPLLNKPIPVVADAYVEKDFGTGAVKITPAHDPNDFEVAMRHNLPIIRVLTDDGKMNEQAVLCIGMDRHDARKKIAQMLSDCGALVKTEDYNHSVGNCYRCHTIVEPIISKQWFVSMKPLAQPAIEAVRSGDIKVVPERFEKTYFNWMENIRDWCISRQLWWGHRIPAYYCETCGELVVAFDAPEQCPKCGSTSFRQDEDVLDTWFSSGLWPFSTLGWPDKTPELDYFYPTSVLVTGYDIIFFWVARMIVFGLSQMNERPFENVLVHGIVRDAQGRKMSKSLGNGIDPLEIIEKYGADSLRFSLTTGNSAGNDMRFYWEKVEACRNFCNKIWNASRFVMMNVTQTVAPIELVTLDIADKWMLSRLNAIIRDVTSNLEGYEMGIAAQKLYDFVWSEFCDWYIEMAKPRLYGTDADEKAAAISVLVHTLSSTVKLLHPFMPFITEEIYTHLPGSEETIMRAAWPVANEAFDFAADEKAMAAIMELIRMVRNIRAEMNVAPSKRTNMVVVTSEANAQGFITARAYLQKLAYANDVQVRTDKQGIPENAVSAVSDAAEIYIPLEELVDTAKELERLGKEKTNLESEIERANAKLNNEGFVSKAPAKVIDEVRLNLEKYQNMLEKINERIAGLNIAR